MQRTNIGALVGVFVFIAAAMGIITWRFYGYFPPLPSLAAITIWLLALVCVALIIIVRRNMAEGTIGLDRSQLHPMTVARMMVVGKASAWTGAILGGLYAGIATYVIPNADTLVAADAESPTVIAAVIGSVALSVAGVVLERNCETPPPPDADRIG